MSSCRTELEDVVDVTQGSRRDWRWAIVRRLESGRESLRLEYYGLRAATAARYWGVELGPDCRFLGPVLFSRTGYSRIQVGESCVFRSAYWANRVGVNHPCMLTTREPGAELIIGPRCGLSGASVTAAERVVLGSDVLCGANVSIMDTDWHSLDAGSGRAAAHAPVTIGDGVWLGLNVTVLKGVAIGAGTVVAAGSIVLDSLPPAVLAAGQPAVVVREF
jgi:acetyltransferase-like isoleucine patch superfamily enzyme